MWLATNLRRRRPSRLYRADFKQSPQTVSVGEGHRVRENYHRDYFGFHLQMARLTRFFHPQSLSTITRKGHATHHRTLGLRQFCFSTTPRNFSNRVTPSICSRTSSVKGVNECGLLRA